MKLSLKKTVNEQKYSLWVTGSKSPISSALSYTKNLQQTLKIVHL